MSEQTSQEDVERRGKSVQVLPGPRVVKGDLLVVPLVGDYDLKPVMLVENLRAGL